MESRAAEEGEINKAKTATESEEIGSGQVRCLHLQKRHASCKYKRTFVHKSVVDGVIVIMCVIGMRVEVGVSVTLTVFNGCAELVRGIKGI